MMSHLDGLTASYNQKGNEHASKVLLPELLLKGDNKTASCND